MNRDLIGKEYPPFTYEVGREKIREYALATKLKNRIHLDPEVARKSPYGTVVAPPTFAAVYCGGVLKTLFTDRDLGMDVPRIVHGEQAFRFGDVVKSGDRITTTARIDDIFSKSNESGVTNEFLVVKTISLNHRGRMVCEGVWTLLERGEALRE